MNDQKRPATEYLSPEERAFLEAETAALHHDIKRLIATRRAETSSVRWIDLKHGAQSAILRQHGDCND